MADARRMGKTELFSHFAERFDIKRTQAREFFDELEDYDLAIERKDGDHVSADDTRLALGI